MNKQRLEAFSDGVFAIVITLLILNIKIPDVQPTALPAALVNMLPQLLTYVLSFFIIGLYWHLHHQVAAQFKFILTIYGLNLILVNVTGFVILVYSRYHPTLRFQPMSSAELRAIVPIYVAVNSLYALAIGVAWLFPWLSYAIYFFVLLWVTARAIRRVSPTLQDQERA